MDTCQSIYQEHQINETFDLAVELYGKFLNEGNAAALVAYREMTKWLAQLTGEPLAEVGQEVIETVKALNEMSNKA